jgi:hypothetical protein
MALAFCILGKFLGVGCHCFPPPLHVPTFVARCPHVRNDARDPSSERWNCGQEHCPVILPKWQLPRHLGIFYTPQCKRCGTHGFTSPLMEGVLMIFSPLKIRRLWPRLNPQTWVLKASTLPLDHQSHYTQIYTKAQNKNPVILVEHKIWSWLMLRKRRITFPRSWSISQTTSSYILHTTGLTPWVHSMVPAMNQHSGLCQVHWNCLMFWQKLLLPSWG